MNKRIRVAFLFPVIFISCAINRLNDEKTVITLESPQTENPVQISLTKGPQWSHKITPGPFIIHIYPQIVFWLEVNEGAVFKTLYITGANGDFSRHSTKRKLDAQFFKQCFPVWADKVIKAGERLPSAQYPYPDAVTSATPQSSFDLQLNIGNISEIFTIYAEINKTGDYNAVYTKENSDWVGQPSVIYAVKIHRPVTGEKIVFKPVGHSQAGSTPVLCPGFEGLDTALEMVNDLHIKFGDGSDPESG
jgi:hypothetical protein